MPEALQHTARRMVGRDPAEGGRASTPLELLFDLTFVIAFGAAADELAHLVSDDHVSEGVIGFCFATFAVSWAWIGFSWFASAYDTDDWKFRLTTMVQMVGVLVLALGVPTMFESVTHHEEHLDVQLMVVGYVIMRLPMVFQWLRAGRQDPARRALCSKMVGTLVVAQVGWVLMIFANPSMGLAVVLVHIADPSPLTVAIFMGIGVLLGGLPGLGSGSDWIPTAALLCLLYTSPSPRDS